MKMDESTLKSAISNLEQSSLGYLNGDLAGDRADSLKAYLSDPNLYPSPEGRSKVTTSDVADAVEGILPGLVRVFTSGEDIAAFEPFGPEDEEQAQQETDVCNYVLTQQNRFLPFLQTWLRDGLISKVGYAKAIWDQTEHVEEETYRGLSIDEVAYLMQDPEIDIIGQDVDEFGGFAIKVKIKKTSGKMSIFNCPPEEVLVNTDHSEVSLSKAKFVQHRTRITVSEVRSMGYKIDDSISDFEDNDWREEEQTRNRYEEENELDTIDPASRIVTLKESYLRIDFDGDGITELRKVCMIGETVLSNEPIDSIPIVAWTPLILPHRHVGRSLAEQVLDIQATKTGILRAGMDSLFLSLNGRYAVSDQVNLDDMLVNRPGGIVRMEGGAVPGQGHIMPMVPPDVSGSAFPMLEYFDGVRETRTGITRYNQGLDANSLNKTATGVSAIMSAAQQRIELVARTFAETGLRDLITLIHEGVRKNNTKPMTTRLRNKWVTVDPRSWKNRYDMTITVGLGTGNREQQMANLVNLMQVQREAIQIGVTTPENVYNAASKLSEAAGFKNPDLFFSNPANQQPKEPQPDPKAMEVQAKMQMEQAKMQADQQKNVAEMQIKQAESQQNMQIEQAKLALEAEKIKMQMELEQMKAQAQAQLELQKLQMQAEIEMQKQSFGRETELMRASDNQKQLDDITAKVNLLMASIVN